MNLTIELCTRIKQEGLGTLFLLITNFCLILCQFLLAKARIDKRRKEILLLPTKSCAFCKG